MHRLFAVLVFALLSPLATPAEQPVRVFAAASLTTALNEVGNAWERSGHPAPSLAYGASSTLARQIGAGAPADVFASADLGWMDYLDERGWIVPGTRVNLLGNRLVLIAPAGRGFPVRMEPGFGIADAFTGRLCTGEPGIVPVGIYAQQSLKTLGWWAALERRIVGTDDVRTALAFVERAQCAAGIVYETDARITPKVEVIGRFPGDSHAPIVYPFALVKDARPEALAFHAWLTSAPEAAEIFTRLGFTVLPEAGR